jgi:extradiol dioxygenase family protein|eukprot:COSAG06_NODE_9290_length_1937_cov_6.475517_3_plen_98_part_00
MGKILGAKNASFAPFLTKNDHFYQDRLGTNIGISTQKEINACFAGMLLDEESGVRSQDAMYCMAGVSLNLVYGRSYAWSWFKENWDALFEKFGTGGR